MEPARDYYLGDSEGEPAHWGGEPRKAFVIGHPTLATGAVVDLVRVDAPIPRSNGAPLHELIVMARSSDDHLEAMADAAIVVNLIIPIDGIDIHRPAFADGELRIQYWADAARTPELLPKPLDRAAFWAKTLSRIRRFIERFGHSRVPNRYARRGRAARRDRRQHPTAPRGSGGGQSWAIPRDRLRRGAGEPSRLGVVTPPT